MGFTTIDPASGDELESFAYMPFAHVAGRLDGARAAGREWRDATLETRGGLLREVARRLRAERDGLAATATREMGKPIVQARAEVEKCATCCEYFADNAATMLADQPTPSPASRSYVAFRPLGVVLAGLPGRGSRLDGRERDRPQACREHHALRARDGAHLPRRGRTRRPVRDHPVFERGYGQTDRRRADRRGHAHRKRARRNRRR